MSTSQSFSTLLFIHTSDYFRSLRRKQNVNHLPCLPRLKMSVVGCQLVIGGSEKNRL